MLQTAFGASYMNQASVFEGQKIFKEGRESARDDERCGRSKEVNTTESIYQRVRITMLRFQGSSGIYSVGKGQHSSNRVSGISTRTMRQSTTPSLSKTIWPRWALRQFLTLPVTFGYSLSSEAVVMRHLRRWLVNTYVYLLLDVLLVVEKRETAYKNDSFVLTGQT